MINRDEQAQLLEDCETREEKLSDWERNFIDSIGKQMAEGHSLTDKQVERLEEIWEKVT